MRYRGQLLAVCATGCAVAFTGLPDAGAVAPAVTAWWSVTNLGAAAAPAPPDVKSDDLFVQGSNAMAPGTVPGVLTSPSAQAFAAISFALPAGAVVGPLRLLLDPAASVRPAMSVVACRVTRTFRAVQNGPFAEAPGYDPANCVPATLAADGTSIVFTQVASLVRNTTLAIALVPGPLDRVVLLPPSTAALTVALAEEVPQLPVPAGRPAPKALTPAGVVRPTIGSRPADVLVLPQPVLAPVLVPVTAPSAAAVPVPVVAGQALAVPAAVTRALPGSRQGRLLAGCGFLGLLAFSAVGASRNLAQEREANVLDRGVGRYRSTRNGKAPRLS